VQRFGRPDEGLGIQITDITGDGSVTRREPVKTL
jgi:hypothetical protein